MKLLAPIYFLIISIFRFTDYMGAWILSHMWFLILPIEPWQIRSIWALSIKACWPCWLTYQPSLSYQSRQWIVASSTASLRCPTPKLWQFMQLLNKLWKLLLAQRTLRVHFGGRLMVQHPAFSNHSRSRLQQNLEEGRLMCSTECVRGNTNGRSCMT